MSNTNNATIIAHYERWILGTDRGDNTIRLRMRHMRAISGRIDLATATEDDLRDVLATTRDLSPETRKS